MLYVILLLILSFSFPLYTLKQKTKKGTVMFLMQAGFAMISAGSVRQKNIQNTLMKNLLDACGAAIGFWAIGYSFSYSYLGQVPSEKGTFIGNSYFFMTGLDAQTGFDSASYDKWFFHFAFAATSATIVAGALAERCQMISYVLYSFIITGTCMCELH